MTSLADINVVFVWGKAWGGCREGLGPLGRVSSEIQVITKLQTAAVIVICNITHYKL